MMVARAMESLFFERERIFAMTSVTPAYSRTVRIAEPATRPRPADGMMVMTEGPSIAVTVWRMELLSVRFTVMR